MRRRRWPALLPFLAVSVLAGALASEVEQRIADPGRAPLPRTFQDITQQSAAPAAAAQGSGAQGRTRPAAYHVRYAVQRNLFAVNRRAPPLESAPQPRQVTAPSKPTTAPNLDARLTGVVLAGERSVAVIEDMRSESVRRLRPGETIQGWELAELSVLGARFRNQGYERVLTVAFGEKGEETAPRNTLVAGPDAAASQSAPVRKAPGFTFPQYEGGTVESMQGTGGVLRPATGGTGGNVRDGFMRSPR